MGRVVIGIAGAPGSGKSTVAGALAEALDGATLVRMDSYERMTRQDIDAVAAWAARGGGYDELPVPLLPEHLGELKAGRAVRDPATGQVLQPTPHLLLETQFGRAHRASGAHIDWLVWLDAPLDVALARTLRRLAKEALAAPSPQLRGRMEWLHGYLANYLQVVQPLLRRQREQVMPGADLVVAADQEPGAIVRQVLAALGRRGGEPA